MPGLLIYPRADAMREELKREAPINTVAIGATSAQVRNPVVIVAVPTPAGWVVAETDLALLLTAAEAFVKVHGDPRKGRT